MKCRRVRDRLTRSPLRDGAVRGHLEECSACSDFARRLADVEIALGGHHAQVAPSPDFAARLRTHLPEESDLLGWAAWRLLPATVCVLLLLSWLNLRSLGTDAETVDPTEAVLTWVVDTELPFGENR